MIGVAEMEPEPHYFGIAGATNLTGCRYGSNCSSFALNGSGLEFRGSGSNPEVQLGKISKTTQNEPVYKFSHLHLPVQLCKL
jgi:hypothetical protein